MKSVEEEMPLSIQQLSIDVKKNGGQPERRSRRALWDIGNIVIPVGVEIGKGISSCRPQLVENADTAALDYNVKKQQGESKQKKHEAPKRTSKKPSTSLTSILTARSKAACGITAKPKDQVVNIDESDTNNELAEVEYVDDIYRFYKFSEAEVVVRDYIGSQPELNDKMRAILIDWLVETHGKFELMPETLYLTINIVDRYLSAKNVSRRDLQLVGIAALLIACKYEEVWAPLVKDLISVSDSVYSGKQILAMEKAILGQLGWYLTIPTPYVFLVRFTKASLPYDNKMENMVFFLSELALLDYSVNISYKPSRLAASVVYGARSLLNKTPVWTELLKHYTGYFEDELRDCANNLVTYRACAGKIKLKTVYTKYLKAEKGGVALFHPAASVVADGDGAAAAARS